MFTRPNAQIDAFSALQTAYRRAAEQALREESARPVPPLRSVVAGPAGASAGMALALTLFGPLLCLGLVGLLF